MNKVIPETFHSKIRFLHFYFYSNYIWNSILNNSMAFNCIINAVVIYISKFDIVFFRPLTNKVSCFVFNIIIYFLKSFLIDCIWVKLFINEHFVDKQKSYRIFYELTVKRKDKYSLGPIETLFRWDTVKPVLRGHLWVKETWPYKTGDLFKEAQFIWNFLLTG